MDIKSLSVFCDLADDLRFNRVAERHAMSASTLSRLVQRLELEAGEALLARDNRNVSLTPAGLRYLEFARSTLTEWQKFRAEVNCSADQIQGEVSLYCSVTASHSLLSQFITRLAGRYSAVDINIHTGDQALSIERVLAGEEDMAIAARPDKLDTRLAFHTLSTTPLLLIGPAHQCTLREQIDDLQRAFAKSKTSSSDQALALCELPWILPERGLVRTRVDQWFRQQRRKPSIYAQVTGNEPIVSMVSLGLGVGLVPELVLTNSPAFDSIVVLADTLGERVSFNPIEIGLCIQKRRLVEPLLNAVWSVAAE